MVKHFRIIALVWFCLIGFTSFSQEKVNWLTFEELEIQHSRQPKPILLYFHADWCVYCKKMDRKVFTDPEVVQLLNADYYAVSFDAETTQEVDFGNKTYINDQVGKSRTPLHQITQLLATRKGEFVAPTLVILNKGFNITARYFEYMTSDELIHLLY